MTLTKDALIDHLRGNINLSTSEARMALELLLEQMKSCLENGDPVKISGFGKWDVKNKHERPGRNPYTGQKLRITARRVVSFHPADHLRDSVNKPQSTPAG